MPLRQHEPVTIGIVGRGNAQHVCVERANNIGDRESGADVPDIRALRLRQDDLPDSLRHLKSPPHPATAKNAHSIVFGQYAISDGLSRKRSDTRA